MNAESIDRVIALAEGAGLLVVHSFPEDAASVSWPSDVAADFISAAVKLQAGLVYVQPRSSKGPQWRLVGFPLQGIVNVFEAWDSEVSEEADSHATGLHDDFTDDEADLSSGFRVSVSWRDDDYEALPPTLRGLVDAALADVRYDQHSRTGGIEVLGELCADLATDDFERVQKATRGRFWDKVGRRLDAEADRIAPRLVQHPEYTTFDSAKVDALIRDEFGVTDERVAKRAGRKASEMARENGTSERHMRERREEARRIRANLPSLVVDQACFTNRIAQHHSLLDRHLDGVTSSWGDALASGIVQVETPEEQKSREMRFGAAAHDLKAQGMSGAAISRTLGIGKSAVDKLLQTKRPNVNLTPDDPIVLELAPSLRS